MRPISRTKLPRTAALIQPIARLGKVPLVGLTALCLIGFSPPAVRAAPPAANPAVAAAYYEVTFDASWSMATHPVDFPSNPHFSGLIGGTHNAGATFWEDGSLATIGIQRMAEWGSRTPLDEEVEAAIATGTAEFVLRGGIIATSPGATSLTFGITEAYSLVTLVSMVAPSPDWFIGVSGVDLRAGGAWLPELVVTLWPYDAGTDGGTSYDAPNQPTDPHVPIGLITSVPLGNGVPLGTFTFRLLGEVTDVPALDRLTLTCAPNPFNPFTRFSFTLPSEQRAWLAVFDLRGRLVDVLLDEPRPAGRHEVAYVPHALASGTYLYVLRTTEGTLSGRMTLAK